MENKSSPDPRAIPQKFFIIPVGCLILIYILSIWIFAKCKKITKSVKWWFQQILISNIMALILFIIAQYVLEENIDPSFTWFRILDGSSRLWLLAGNIGIFALGCERWCSLKYAMQYEKYTTKRRLWACAICINIASTIASLTVFWGDIRFEKEQLSINATNAAALSTVITVLTFSFMSIILYSMVGYIALKKKRSASRDSSSRENDYSRFLTLTVKCFILVMVYCFMVLPAFISDFICLVRSQCPEMINNAKLIIGLLRLSFYFCLPFIFVTSSYESRYVFLMVFCRRAKYGQRLEMEYKQQYATYDIATVSRTHRRGITVLPEQNDS